MSQWGVTRVVKGCVFIPLVDTPGFVEAQGHNAILDVLLINSRGEGASDVLDSLKTEHIGEAYKGWLESAKREHLLAYK